MVKVTKIDAKTLAENLPTIAKMGDAALPPWITKIEEIVKEINKMGELYLKMSAQNPITTTPGDVVPKTPKNVLGFEEARLIKKAELAVKNPQKEVVIMPNNEFKELLQGIIKSFDTLESLGFSPETPIGQVISSLPFTLNQSKVFIQRLLMEKYND